MKKIKWIGSNTARNISWEYKTDTLRDLYELLVSEGIISFFDETEPIIADYAELHDLDLNDEDEYLEAYENAFDIPDEDYKDYIARETGDAYYQWFYRWDDKEGWVEF